MNAVIENWPIIAAAIVKCWPLWGVVPAVTYVIARSERGRRWIRS